MRIHNDKYYTPIPVANYCWDRAYEVIGGENITEVIEPSIGSGAFCHHPFYHPDVGYDIEPECESNEFTQVCQHDFLKLPDNYKTGRLIIGNTPYGDRLNLAQQFYRKSTTLGDYIAFILPISQKDNTSSLYQFDLIHSEDLGEHDYSGHKLHCCFNIYKRPPNGRLNKKPQITSKHIEICRKGEPRYPDFEYDFRLCYWGANAGRLLKDDEDPTGVYKIKVINPSEKEIIYKILDDFPKVEAISVKSITKEYIQQLINNKMEKNNVAVCQPKDKNEIKSAPVKNPKTEDIYKEFTENQTSYIDFSQCFTEAWDGQELEVGHVYHLNKMRGLSILVALENRRQFQRFQKMLEGCQKHGMTTPAILIKAKLLHEWGLQMVDPITLNPATPEQIESSYVIMEGNGRFGGYLLGYATQGKEPFDFKFVYNEYSTPEEGGEAYTSTNLYMTRTTNKDRFNIAGAVAKDPLVLACNQRINEDGCIAKAAYFWTFGRELSIKEACKYVDGDTDAPKFNQALVEARNGVYEAFKAKFSSEKGRKVYGSVTVAQWVCDMLSSPGTSDVVSEKICSKLESMSNDLYDTIITAKTSKAKKTKREDVIINALDEMMAA